MVYNQVVDLFLTLYLTMSAGGAYDAPLGP